MVHAGGWCRSTLMCIVYGIVIRVDVGCLVTSGSKWQGLVRVVFGVDARSLTDGLSIYAQVCYENRRGPRK
jgi:hypothetical protein